jgi:tetratricopeptide (TPR) repeat protein
MILNTLYANRFRKPLYFAVTVSRDNMMDDLQKYLRMDGLAFKITAIPDWQIDPDTLYDNLMNKYLYRNLNNPNVFYDDNIIALLQNYRSAFIQLSNYYANSDKKNKIAALMSKVREVMPPSVIPYTNPMLKYWMESYEIYSGIRKLDSLNLANYQVAELESMGKILFNLRDYSAAEAAFQHILNADPSNIQAKAFLVDVYASQKNYVKSIDILENWLKENPQDVGAKRRLEEFRRKLQNEQGQTR